ncbi:glycosyl transferase [Artomyces pyxidatus]|uniref:Glycosyl transferase n=1 Tax=Artomyces pyxidatus TaxID=48021 RepID=A0ACB8T0L9_9AGAM|nr:glycosyl transferase [Artomyces pyxidatus]
MRSRARIVLTGFLVGGFFGLLHLILTFSVPSYSPSSLLSSVYPPALHYTRPDHAPLSTLPRANATFVVLCRNSDLAGIMSSVQQMEDRFNKRYGYPWVFLNDEPFTEEFKTRLSTLTDAHVSFGTIPKEHWVQPDWIDEERAAQQRKSMSTDMLHFIPYAGSVSYRNMCRFNSGFFFQHELLQPYRYYWRVEPDVRYFCDLDYDPFAFMESNGKTYGFTVALEEYRWTILSLWDTVKEFMKESPHLLPDNNLMSFISDDWGNTYNYCHFWSNFEIADMDFWRGEAYTKFFNFLDQKGGFYYERWGDAPVHSIAASLFLRKDEIHFFGDIGYRHDPFQMCPQGDVWTRGRCSCNPKETMDVGVKSCMAKYTKANLTDAE